MLYALHFDYMAGIITIAFCRVRMCIINASLGEDLCLWIEPVLFLLYQHTMLPSLPTLPASRTLLKGRIAACTRQLDEVFEWVKFFLAQPQETGWPVGETAKILVY